MASTGTTHLRNDVILSVTELVVEFPARKKQIVHAVSGVSFDLDEGETLGIVGESGCGKTTTGRAIMQLESVTSGSIRLNGVDLVTQQGEQLRQARKAMQMIFQDPVSSLNPSRRVRDIVREGIDIWGSTREGDLDAWVAEVMESVGLGDEGVADRRPHEFPGGLCQRVSRLRDRPGVRSPQAGGTAAAQLPQPGPAARARTAACLPVSPWVLGRSRAR